MTRADNAAVAIVRIPIKVETDGTVTFPEPIPAEWEFVKIEGEGDALVFPGETNVVRVVEPR
jgi:hypothetical protein